VQYLRQYSKFKRKRLHHDCFVIGPVASYNNNCTVHAVEQATVLYVLYGAQTNENDTLKHSKARLLVRVWTCNSGVLYSTVQYRTRAVPYLVQDNSVLSVPGTPNYNVSTVLYCINFYRWDLGLSTTKSACVQSHDVYLLLLCTVTLLTFLRRARSYWNLLWWFWCRFNVLIKKLLFLVAFLEAQTEYGQSLTPHQWK